MLLKRKPVRVTIKLYSNMSVDNVMQSANNLGMDINHCSYNFGEIWGRISPGNIRALRNIKAVHKVVRHRPTLDRLMLALDMS